MLPQGAYQANSASEWIRLGLDQARASGKRVGCPPARSHDQVGQWRGMVTKGEDLRHITRVMGCSPATMKVLALEDK